MEFMFSRHEKLVHPSMNDDDSSIDKTQSDHKHYANGKIYKKPRQHI